MADILVEISRLADPINRVLDSWRGPSGLRISKVSAPIGVIGMIYESRPSVAVDAFGLCIKSGNAVILRGGSDSEATTAAIHAAVLPSLDESRLPSASIQVAPTASRNFVSAMLGAVGDLDLLIPRGGRSLVELVQRKARVPALSHAEGVCHTYVHQSADLRMAIDIIANAKLRRLGVCGATETLLIDANVFETYLPPIVRHLTEKGCSLVGDARACAVAPAARPAAPEDFRREWQDKILSIAVVDGIDGAIDHIRSFGSAHTDAIVAADPAAAQQFLREVDSAVTVWNASTQFSDGGEFGYGAEIGISRSRLHARGPIGAEQLTTVRYLVVGSGQLRP